MNLFHPQVDHVKTTLTNTALTAKPPVTRLAVHQSCDRDRDHGTGPASWISHLPDPSPPKREVTDQVWSAYGTGGGRHSGHQDAEVLPVRGHGQHGVEDGIHGGR
jgi:hypothetical protein